jgi:hypothetical protein
VTRLGRRVLAEAARAAYARMMAGATDWDRLSVTARGEWLAATAQALSVAARHGAGLTSTWFASAWGLPEVTAGGPTRGLVTLRARGSDGTPVSVRLDGAGFDAAGRARVRVGYLKVGAGSLGWSATTAEAEALLAVLLPAVEATHPTTGHAHPAGDHQVDQGGHQVDQGGHQVDQVDAVGELAGLVADLTAQAGDAAAVLDGAGVDLPAALAALEQLIATVHDATRALTQHTHPQTAAMSADGDALPSNGSDGRQDAATTGRTR